MTWPRGARPRSSCACRSSSSSSASRASRSCGSFELPIIGRFFGDYPRRDASAPRRPEPPQPAGADAWRASRRAQAAEARTGRRRGSRRRRVRRRARPFRPLRASSPAPRARERGLAARSAGARADAELVRQSRPPQVDHRRGGGRRAPQPAALVGRIDRASRRRAPFGPRRRRLERRVERPGLAGAVVARPRSARVDPAGRPACRGRSGDALGR